MICEILSVGTELLMGQIANTDAQFLARRLSMLGITMHRQTTVGDNPGRVKAALGEALARADLVITTGGLGPTEDDLTKEMVARALKNAGADVRYVSAGIVFSLDKDGKLEETQGAPEAQPVSWPVGHDVRAARQARGAEPVKCAACHTGDSEFFLGEVTPVGRCVQCSRRRYGLSSV